MTTTAERPTRRAAYQIPAELSLIGFTLAVVAGFGRVFSDASFFVPLAVVALVAHALLLLLRRLGWGVTTSALVSIPVLAVVIAEQHFFFTTTAGIPTGTTWTQVRESLSTSWATFQNVSAPAPVQPGFLMACSVALFFAVFLSDWAAFRLWSTWEAVVPGTTLFIFCSLLGSTVNREWSTGLFILAGLAFILLHTVAKRETSAGWLSADVARGSAALLRVGAGLAVVAAVAGLVIGPRLPGADGQPLVCWNKCAEGGQKGDRFTISPLVEIRNRLVDQANVELFTVNSPTRAYWRMTSLDTFDGNSWRSKGKFTVADGDLEAPSLPTDSSQVEQQYRITGLARLWIPAAYQPVYVSEEAKARFQSDSATLIVDTDLDTSDGLQYTVRSKIPSFSPEQLQKASTSVPDDIRQRYLALPSDFSQKARDEAARVAGGQSTAYDKARALQDWFRGGDFTYNLKVQPGHGEKAIDDFLLKKEGYCEQFAGTFAAMARSLGIPARVAVGFTWGDPDPNTPNLYHVRGEHAHAWPEVYLGEYGWVPFEPTPDRGAPGAQRWTGVSESQATPDPGASTTTTASPGTTVVKGPTTTAPTTSPFDPNQLATEGSGADGAADQGGGVLLTGLKVLGVVVVGALGYLLVVGGLLGRRRNRRRHQAADPSARVRVAWQESIEELSLVGVRPQPAETNDEFATRVAGAVPESTTAVMTLATDTDAAAFAAVLVDDRTAARAEDAATEIAGLVKERTGWRRAVRRTLDPRPLWRGVRPRPRHQATDEGSNPG